LLYALEQGPVEKRIIDQCMRERLPLPQRIQDAPELWIGLELYYGAFVDLNTCRPSGWGMCPIPWTAIADYASVYRITGEQKDDLFYFVRAMDAAFMGYCQDKEKK
jgi:hypothetical protein